MPRKRRERAGLIVVRIWIEGLLPAGLRAKITHLPDLDSTQEESEYASSVDDAVEIVRDRLERFVAEAAEDDGVTRV